MKSRASVLAAALTGLALASSASAQTNVSVQKVAEGVWMATPDRGANVGWFVASDGVVVVDSGADAETAKTILGKVAETANKPVRFVVITHAHGDHAGGVAVFAAAGARVVCHENAAAPIAGLIAQARAADPKSADAGVLAVSERLAFLGGPRRAAIYHLGPGHTNGDLIVLLPEEKILFSGDLVLNGRLPYLQSADADPRGWEQILNRLAALDVAKIVPGHGDLGTRQAISDTYGYIHKVNELATQFIRSKVPDDLYEMRLRDPENRIENVSVNADHIANVRAAVKLELARLAAAAKVTPTPGPKPQPAPSKKAS
jgi:glyoxylase-like metal-dependent hydrolase (beta-lactamase superfamily II)